MEKESTVPPVSREEESSVTAEKPNAPVKEDTPDVQGLDLDNVSISEEEVLKSPSSMIDEADKALEAKKLDGTHGTEEEQDAVSAKEKQQFEVQSMKSEDIREKSGEAVGRTISDYLEEGGVEEEEEPVFDGTEVSGMEGSRTSLSSDNDSETQGSAWPDKAVALSHYVKQKSIGAVSTVMRRLSGKSDDGLDASDRDKEFGNDNLSKGDNDSLPESVGQKISQIPVEKSGWNPLNLISREKKSEQEDSVEDAIAHPVSMKGRIILYTRLGCQDCMEARRYLKTKGLKYVEINIDVYPSRKVELEKIGGSLAVPRVFFNEILIGGMSELKKLEDSGKLEEKIEYVVTEEPSYEAPLPPLSGEDDLSSDGIVDELALIVRKMKGVVSIKDRFHKVRRYTDCFQGKDAVDFLSEDQYLEREEVSSISFSL